MVLEWLRIYSGIVESAIISHDSTSNNPGVVEEEASLLMDYQKHGQFLPLRCVLLPVVHSGYAVSELPSDTRFSSEGMCVVIHLMHYGFYCSTSIWLCSDVIVCSIYSIW